jgi:hypothetical protein
MGVKTQVSGNKVQSIQASKNLGTVVNTQLSGEKSNGQLGYRKITNVQKTHLDGLNKVTNYMGINNEGMNIMEAKKVDNEFYNKNQYDCQNEILEDVNERIAIQELDKKLKTRSVAEPATVEEGTPEDELGE